MEIFNDEYKSMEVSYKFYLPDNRDELILHQNATKFFMALHDIHDRCRHVWKYKENATEAEVDFAERIDEIVSESGIYDVE